MAPLLLPLGVVGSGKRAPSPYWISTISTTVFEANQDIAIDSNNNIFVIGLDSDTLPEAILIKYDSMGNVLFIKKFKTSTNRETYFCSLEIDSADNLCIVGSGYDTNSSRLDYTVTKIDNSGNIVWQKALYDGTNSYNSFHDKLVDVDNSNNVYGMTQTTFNPSVNVYISDMKLVKLNSSGTLLTQRHFRDADGRESRFVGLKVNKTNGEIYVCGGTNEDSFTTNIATIFKTDNAASSVSWSKQLPPSDPEAYSDITEISVDDSGNVYSVGYDNSTQICFLTKFNSSGTVQWQVQTPYSGAFWLNVEVDKTSGNIYVGGRDQSTSNVILFKFNSSGTLLWQRMLSQTSYGYTRPLYVSDDSQFVVVGTDKNLAVNSEYNLVAIKVPADGSLTGSHKGSVYSVSSYPVTTFSGSWSDANMQTAATSSYSTTLSMTNATAVGTDITQYDLYRTDMY